MWNILIGLLIGITGSVIAAGLIFRLSLWYNKKKLSDERENEYTRLTNQLENLTSKLDIESEARKNQFDNLNEKFDNGFDRVTLEIEKMITNVNNNTEKIDLTISELAKTAQHLTNIMPTINDLQKILFDYINKTR